MAVNLKIVSQVVASGTPGPAGKSAYQTAVDNGFVGTESEWLKSLLPFKGWYDSVSELEAAHANPLVGEYAYVKGATSSDPVKIYECSTEGTWSDSGRTVDTSSIQTFGSGEAVNDVDITGDSSDIEENSDKIPTAGAVAGALGNAEFSTGEKVKNVGVDDEPTAGSDNLVKSGGITEALSFEESVGLGSEIAGIITDSKYWYVGNNSHYIIPVFPGEVYKIVANANYQTIYYFLANDHVVDGSLADISQIESNKHIIAINKSQFCVIPSDTSFLYLLGTSGTTDFTPNSVTNVENYQKIIKDFDNRAKSAEVDDILDVELKWIYGFGIYTGNSTSVDYGKPLSNQNFKCSEFIDISDYRYLFTKIITATSNYGHVFYDSNKNVIGTLKGGGSVSGYSEVIKSTIPLNAKYIRITALTNSTFGEQILKLSEPDFITFPLSILPNDPYFGWYRLATKELVNDARIVTTNNFLKCFNFTILADEGWRLNTFAYNTEDATLSFLNDMGQLSDTNAGYKSSKKIVHSDKYLWLYNLTNSDTSDISSIPIDDILSHFHIKMSKSEFLEYLNENKSLDIENKLSNPLFETFSSFNSETGVTPLVKETIFGQGIDGATGEVRRIPTVCITNNDTVLAVTEVRISVADNSGCGISLARKESGSSVWNYTQILPFDRSTQIKYMNPSFVVDRTGAHDIMGRIYLFCIAFPITESNNGYAAYATTEEIDCIYIYSDDDGVTWSNKTSIKSVWDTNEWIWVGPSPANGIQLLNGELAIPCMGRYEDKWYSAILRKTIDSGWIFSKRSNVSGDNESCIFENNGLLYLNCRNDGNFNSPHIRNLYKYLPSSNSLYKVKYDYDPNLRCQQSISQKTAAGKTIYLQSANDPIVRDESTEMNNRKRLTIWASANGFQWVRLIRINDILTYGYSSVDIYQNRIVVVYENLGTVSFIDLTPIFSLLNNTQYKVCGQNKETLNQVFVDRFLEN